MQASRPTIQIDDIESTLRQMNRTIGARLRGADPSAAAALRLQATVFPVLFRALAAEADRTAKLEDLLAGALLFVGTTGASIAATLATMQPDNPNMPAVLRQTMADILLDIPAAMAVAARR